MSDIEISEMKNSKKVKVVWTVTSDFLVPVGKPEDKLIKLNIYGQQWKIVGEVIIENEKFSDWKRHRFESKIYYQLSNITPQEIEIFIKTMTDWAAENKDNAVFTKQEKTAIGF